MSEPPVAGAKVARTLAARLKKEWRRAEAGATAVALIDHPELAEYPSVVADLAYEEYLLLEKAGRAPAPASFAAGLPACRSLVRSVIAEHRRFTDEPDLLADLDDADWPLPGDTVGGVELTAELGGGGFGRAYLAYDPDTDRACVLKLAAGPSAEARVIGRLAHPHVTGVYWAREIDGRAAVCMPLVGANTLADVIAAADPTGTADVILTVAGADEPADSAAGEVVRAGEPYLVGAAAVAARVADAVAYLHRQGVAHADLKPANVVVGRGGSPLLIDFNLATRPDGPAAVRGTPGYLAPELLEAADPLATTADPKRADLFALGVLVTELLTGRRPFPPADPKSFAAQAAAARTPPVIAAAVPAAVAVVLRACLDPDPAERPESAAVLAAALNGVVAAARTPAPPRPRRRWRVAAAAAALMAVAALSYGVMQPSPTGARPLPTDAQPVQATVPPVQHEPRPPKTAEEFFARGWERKKAEDWGGASSDFLTSDRLAPNNWTLSLAAYCEAANSKHDDAIGHAEAVDREMAGGAPPDVLNILGYALVQRTRYADALPPLDRALARESLPAAHYNRALARFQLKQNPAGAAADMRAAAAAPGPGSAEFHAYAARVFAAGAVADPGLRPDALRHVRAALAMGAPASLREESVFRAPFRGGFGSALAFEAACATPRVAAPVKVLGLRLVEPRPF